MSVFHWMRKLPDGRPGACLNTDTSSRAQSVAGLIAVAAMLLAFGLANSPLDDWYLVVHHLPVVVQVGSFAIDKPLILWINDGLMVFFFLLITLELKREILEGQLSDPRALAAPGFAALGGMLVPALIYVSFNSGDPAAMRGWAIPTATDAVLALTVLALLGSRVPVSLKVFLTALAIFDDLGAILIIAVFYTDQLAAPSLMMAALGLAALIVLNILDISRVAAYSVVGLFLWITMLESGVHATLAGVAIGLAIPLRLMWGENAFSPLREVEKHLNLWVALGVVPVFAFFNSGIPLSISAFDALISPGSLGIVLGLFAGKQIGVFGATWLAVRIGVAKFPDAASWWQLYGVAVVAGVGFTMSLFVAGLAFGDPEAFRNARLSVVVGSILSVIVAVLVLRYAANERAAVGGQRSEPFS